MESLYNSLDYLSDQEYKIYAWRNSLLNQTRNEVGLTFKEEDINLDYRTIHRQYISILTTSEDSVIKLEALKRLTFLNWEFFVEPEYLTGIVDLDETNIKGSYEILNSYINSGLMDNELKWMLEYYSVWDWTILRFSENMPELNQFVKSVDTSIFSVPKGKLLKGTMDNRGQMGVFWKPIVEKVELT